MIRINLLPPEDRGKGADVEDVGGASLNFVDLRIIIPAVLLLVVGIVFFVMWRGLEGQKDELDTRIAETNSELSRLKKVKSQVEALEKTRAMIDERVREIERLDQNRFYWVQVMDNLASALPEQVWLTTITDQSAAGRPSISLKGEAFSNVRVAEFIRRLEQSEVIEDPTKIELLSSQVGRTQQTLAGSYQLYQFEMRIDLVPPDKLGNQSPPQDNT